MQIIQVASTEVFGFASPIFTTCFLNLSRVNPLVLWSTSIWDKLDLYLTPLHYILNIMIFDVFFFLVICSTLY